MFDCFRKKGYILLVSTHSHCSMDRLGFKECNTVSVIVRVLKFIYYSTIETF